MSTCHSSFFSSRGDLLLRTFILLFAINVRIGFGFYCVSSGEWIPIDWVCDAQSDCSDSSDESYDLNCVYQKIFLKKGRESAAMHNPWRGIHRRSESDVMGMLPSGASGSVSGSRASGSTHEDGGFLDTHELPNQRGPVVSGSGAQEVGMKQQSGAAARGLYDFFRQPSNAAAAPKLSMTMTAPLFAKYLPPVQPGTGVYSGGHVTNGAIARRAATSSDDAHDIEAGDWLAEPYERLVKKSSLIGHETFIPGDSMSEHH